jgi:phospholipid/cholesterol/gamma-HCH transport system substrate-binding protein
MKISNETKVGILAIVALTLLILGFNFLKGKNLFEKSHNIYALVEDMKGLSRSNKVLLNGVEVGSVYDYKPTSDEIRSTVVTITLNQKIRIPANSTISVESNPLGATTLKINRGDTSYYRINNLAVKYLEVGDTLTTKPTLDLMGTLNSKLDPTLASVNSTLDTLKMTVSNINSIFDPATKSSLQHLIANLMVSSANLQQLLNAQTGSLAKSLNNMENFTGNLTKNNDHITKTMENMDAATAKFAALKLDETMNSLNGTISELQKLMAKANGNGSLGKLLNDPALYNNISATTIKLQTLLDDFRLHPKRYTGSIIFNRKDKTGPLTSPVPIDTLQKN